MAILTGIEDVNSNAIIYSFDKRPKATRMDQGFKRRSGTYTVLGMKYGVQMYGQFAPPVAVRPFSWQFRVLVPPGGDLDAAGDKFKRAIGRGREHRLIMQASNKWERVVIAPCIDLQDITTSADNWRHRDFVATWELTRDWRDRVARGPHRIGDGSAPLMGTTALVMGFAATPLTAINQVFNIVADGSDGLADPTIDDDAPVFAVTGPYGCDQGFAINNTQSLLKDLTGATVQTILWYRQPVASGHTIVFDCGAQSVTDNGVDVRANLTIPDYQPWWQQVVAGIINPFQIYGVGSAGSFVVNPAISSVLVSWFGYYW